jgi:hypothetical protein
VEILSWVGGSDYLLKESDNRWENRVDKDYEAAIETPLVLSYELLTVVPLRMLRVKKGALLGTNQRRRKPVGKLIGLPFRASALLSLICRAISAFAAHSLSLPLDGALTGSALLAWRCMLTAPFLLVHILDLRRFAQVPAAGHPGTCWPTRSVQTDPPSASRL